VQKNKKKDGAASSATAEKASPMDHQTDYFLLRKQVDEICSEVLSLDVPTTAQKQPTNKNE